MQCRQRWWPPRSNLPLLLLSLLSLLSVSTATAYTWENRIQDAMAYFRQYYPQPMRQNLYWSIGIYWDGHGANITSHPDHGMIGIVMRNLLSSSMYSVQHVHDRVTTQTPQNPFTLDDWDPNRADRRHPLFELNEAQSMTFAQAYELAAPVATFMDWPTPITGCTLALFTFARRDLGLVYLFRGDEDTRRDAVAVSVTTGIAYQVPRLPMQDEELLPFNERPEDEDEEDSEEDSSSDDGSLGLDMGGVQRNISAVNATGFAHGTSGPVPSVYPVS